MSDTTTFRPHGGAPLDGSRKGDWIQTRYGIQFWPLDPRPNEIDLRDIASALSKACRYAGHCIRFYSVAEHSVLMAEKLPREHRLAALLHDASEAYLVDIPRPIKPFLGGYTDIENRLMSVIAEKYGFSWPLPASVKIADTAMLYDEMEQNMVPPPAPWAQLEYPPIGVTLQYWSPAEAESRFLQAARELGVE